MFSFELACLNPSSTHQYLPTVLRTMSASAPEHGFISIHSGVVVGVGLSAYHLSGPGPVTHPATATIFRIHNLAVSIISLAPFGRVGSRRKSHSTDQYRASGPVERESNHLSHPFLGRGYKQCCQNNEWRSGNLEGCRLP